MQEKLAGYFTLLLYAAGAVGLVWLAVRFLLPWTAPFIVAWLIAALLEMPVKNLVNKGIPRPAASVFCTLAALGVIIWLLAALIWKGFSTVSDYVRTLPGLMEAVSLRLRELEAMADAHISAAPEEAAVFLRTGVSAVGDALYALPTLISKEAMTFLTRTAQASPNTLLFIITAGIGSFLISSSFPRVNAFLLAQLPEKIRLRLEGLGSDLKGSFGGFLRSQLILMAMTFFQLLIAFLILKIPGAAGIAAVTALVDALPVFGTGIILIPWALCSLILGSTRRGIGLLISWAVVNLVRNCTQAKLLGDQIGLDPLASLMSIYVGWQVCGVGGMLIFPILLVTMRQLNDRGVIRLWKNT